eukprot:TRINITY_DN123344_c0_g1_i1.p1 TRINITY_DN123344_c0_g1~~TRINITY_DN123344_c0_g1_i1.p1  ORF type:complete len:398 (+),score=54.18 TRINITY_DN123344_c0_g1_i1:61-1194(+)
MAYPAGAAGFLDCAAESKPSIHLQELFQAHSATWLSALQRMIDAEVQVHKSAVDEMIQEKEAALQKQCSLLEARERDLAERERALNLREEALEHGRTLVVDSRRGGPREIVKLNISGQKHCAVMRETLCRVEDSLLASMFSGRWDDSLDKDENGAVFINFAPDIFQPLVDYLQQTDLPSAEQSPAILPNVPASKLPEFISLAQYFGVADVFDSCRPELHRGSASKVDFRYEGRGHWRVETREWVTVALVRTMPLDVASYEVVVGSTQHAQIGWATNAFNRHTGHTEVGVGDEGLSWALDGRDNLYRCGEVFNVSASWKEGDVVRCVLDRAHRAMRWFINGKEARTAADAFLREPFPEDGLLPFVSAKGSFDVRLQGS